MMKSIAPFAGAAIAAGLLLLGSGCGQPAASSTTSIGTDPGRSGSSVDRVTAGPPVRKTLALTTTQPGRIEAFEVTPLYSKVSAYVEEVLVDIGDEVEKGQDLIRLWVPEMHDDLEQKQALLAQAEAEVKQAEAAVHAAQAGITTAQAGVSQAEAGVGRAEGEYDRSKSEYERMKELAERGSQTQKLVDETMNQLKSAEAARKEVAASVLSAKAELNQAEANHAKAQADVVAARARERVAQADLARATTMLGYTRIKAPFDGMVTRREVDTGHAVQPANGSSSRPLLVIARTDRVRVSVDVPEVEAPLVDGGEQGDSALVRIQSLRNREVEGRVTRTGWALDAANRSLRTEIDLPNDEGQLRPGMYVTVSILLEERPDVLTLPTTAVLRDGQRAYCCVVESGKVDHRPITLGLRSGNEVEILTGVGADDMVVLTRADSLEPGQPVEIIGAD
jgi:HlyD family secretion protein